MIRQLCPHCVQLIELPDDAAGGTVVCSRCARSFSVPAAYTPAVDAAAGPAPIAAPPPVDRPAPPPGLVPPGPPAAALPPAGPTAPPIALPTPAGYNHASGFAVTPYGLAWVPAAGLTIVLVLSFFPWVGSYPGGVRMYSQMPWQAAFGYFTPNPLAEDELALKPLMAMNGWLLLYVLLIVPALALAWAERLIQDKALRQEGRGAWLASIWPLRFPLLTALSALLLVLLMLQMGRGFGLEQAVETLAAKKYEAERAAADTTAKEQQVTVRTGQEVGRFALDGTTALCWAVAAHGVVVAAVAGLWWLQSRGPKPAPQIRAYW